MISSTLQTLRSLLKKISKNKNIVDIVIFGSVAKAKEKPSDIDIAIIFKDEDYDIIQKLSEEIKKALKEKNIHIETLIIDKMFREPLYLTLIHEGFSVKNNAFISKALETKSLMLITYDLTSLNHTKKTLFGYALKGRKGKKGFLEDVKGKTSGRNNILVPTENYEQIKAFFQTWNVAIKTQRFLKIPTVI